jgi:catechol 2,3-dioxygenase-like lactoylglutathione lyase family enzyme
VLAAASIVAFVPIRDFEIAEQFYARTLGLQVLDRDEFALVLQAAGGVMLRCVLIPDAQPAAFTVLGWAVPDIHAAAQILRAANVQAQRYPWFQQDPDGVWTAPNGSKVLWFQDPFANVLSLSQHSGLTTRPDAEEVRAA